MSVARARDLLYRLMTMDPGDLQTVLQNFQSGNTREELRRLFPDFQDVSGEDVLQAIGSKVVEDIVAGQDLTETEKRIFPIITVFSDGIPPCCPPHHHH
jgi:uncharacterized protein YidB (DUF937 family)